MNLANCAVHRKTLEPGIEQIILDQPGRSANVLTQELIDELSHVLDSLEHSAPEIGLIISSAKSGIYIAGADIVAISKTLDWSEQQIIDFCRRGQTLMDRLAQLPCVVVAAIEGVAVGGGLEFALACDARVATADRKTLLGLPEVKLGLIPGWAGTVRLPRLIGLRPAIELITSGRLIAAQKSLDAGLIDALATEHELVRSAIELARRLNEGQAFQARRNKLRGPVRDIGDRDALEREFEAAITKNNEIHPRAPRVALRHMIDSANDDHAIACAKEAVAMSKVYGTEPCAGLIHTFFLSERAKKSGRFAGITAPEIRSVGIVGAGVMGSDIAHVCPVNQALQIFDLDISRAAEVASACNARDGSTSAAIAADRLIELATCDLVVESIVEQIGAKHRVLLEIEREAKPETLLASNTSVIQIEELAQPLTRPEQFCGLHFCYPAKVRRLVEVIRGPRTSDATMAAVCQWVRGLGKVPLIARDAPGFVINRLLCPMFNEAGHLLTQGCQMTEVELAMREFGFSLGPYEFMDAIGIDTLYSAGAILIPRLTTPPEPSLLLHAMHRAGWRGRKSGRGFYCYANADAPPTPNEQLGPMIEQYSRRGGPQIGADEIVSRLLAVMVNQAADLLAEKVIPDPADVDLVMTLGGGFPEHRGGLMFWAQRYGPSRLIEQFQCWRQEPGGDRRYRISPRLAALAAQPDSFAS